jgi:hypothetical protein
MHKHATMMMSAKLLIFEKEKGIIELLIQS